MDDILHLSAQLRSFNFCHVKRNCNRVADAMAKKSRVGLDFQVWVDDLSGDILPLATYSCFNKSSSLVFQSGFLKNKKIKK